MKIAILTPYFESNNRGNAVAVHRWLKGLRNLGEDVEVFSLENKDNWPLVKKNLISFNPDIVHGVQGYRSGGFLMELSTLLDVHFVVSLRGTDVWEDMKYQNRYEIVESVLRLASKVTVLTESMKQEVCKHVPDIFEKVILIHQGVEKLAVNKDFLFENIISSNDKIVLFPANLRNMKNIFYPLDPLSLIVKDFPELKLVYLGPIIEDEIKKRLDCALTMYNWAVYLGVIPHDKIGDIFDRAFAVINCSDSEGMSNALLEGMIMGKPVLAYRNLASLELIKDGVNGFLFEHPNEFIMKLKRLLLEPGLPENIGKEAEKEVMRKYSVEKEITSYHKLYLELLSPSSGAPPHR